jgi:thymidylate kinase
MNMSDHHGLTQDNSQADLRDIVIPVFTAWQQNKIPFVVLRNYENLPEKTGHDIDVLVRPEHLATAERILIETAHAAGYRLSNRVRFSPHSIFLYHPQTLVQVQFDLFHDLCWRGMTLLSARSVLNWRVDRGLFAIPHPIHEAVNDLLGRLIYHDYVKENYKPIILRTVQEFPQESMTVLSRMFGKTVGNHLTSAISNGDWTMVGAQGRAMRRQLIWRRLVYSPFMSAGNLLRDCGRLVSRVLRPPGITIVLLGADGSGKSSVAARLMEALHGTFYKDKSRRYHWKPAVFLRKRRADRPPTTNPHAQAPRGWLASQIMLGFHWVEFLAGSLLLCFPALFRNGMVLIERHHFDFIADPRRYRLRPPCGLVRLAFRLLHQPDLVFLLDAPALVLHARKAEMPLEETMQRREAYRSLIGRLPNGRVIDCTQPLDEVVAAITRETLGYVEKRQARRGGIARA